jgi:RND family efflux transporter MFP subunit
MMQGLMTLAVLAGLLLLLLWQAGIFRTGQVEPGERAVAVAAAVGRPLVLAATEVPVVYRTVGTVRSRDEIDLSPRITARIVEVRFRGGDAVPANEVLIRLDDTDLRAAAARAEERRRAADADLKLAETELSRSRQLLEQKVIPQKTLDQAERDFQAAQANAAAAAEARREADAFFEHATIRCPMAAVVSDRFADPGDMASPGKILMTVFDPTRLMLYVSIRESLVGSVKVGDTLRFRVGALDRDLAGEVREIVPAVDEGSRTFLIKICIGDANGLMPGMFGTLDLELRREPALVIPAAAIRQVGQLEYATVMEPAGPPRPRLIRTAPGPDPGHRRVVTGLAVGETVLLPQ